METSDRKSVGWKMMGFFHSPTRSPTDTYQKVIEYLSDRCKFFATREVSPEGKHHLQFIVDAPYEDRSIHFKQFGRIHKSVNPDEKLTKKYGYREIKIARDQAFNYQTKGLGPETPPTDYWTNIQITPEEIALCCKSYWANRPIEVVQVEGASRKRSRTVFQYVLDYAEENYDRNEIIGPPIKKPRILSDADAVKLVNRFYNADSRMAGTGVRQRCLEELLLRYGQPWYQRSFETRMIENFHKSIK